MAEQKIPQWKDIEHLVKRGSLVKMVYDTEIYNLDRKFPGIYEIGFHIKDVAGNEIGAPLFHLKKPADAMHSIVSNLITRSFPEDHPDAVDFKTFAGKIAQTFDRHYEYIWDRYRDETKIRYMNKGKSKVNEEIVRLFPVADEDAEGGVRYVRLHEGGKRMSYQVPDDSADYNYITINQDGSKAKWRKLYSSAETRGYANTTADDPWLWVTLYMSCHPEIFKTHTKAEHKYRVDLFRAALMFHLWGPQGEEGLKAGERFHPVRQKMVPSFKQSDLIPANTRHEGPFNDRGIRMPNKSHYEPEHAHGTIADTQGTSAVEDILRDMDMELYKHIEMLGDPKYTRRFLMQRATGEPRHFAHHPLRAFARYDLENSTSSHLGMCVETDERFGNMNQAIMLKLDVDWDDIHYNGKRILDIRDKKTLKKAVKNLVFNKFGKVDSLVEISHVRKTPMVVTGEHAVGRGIHSQEEYELAVRNRSKILKNRNFMDAVMEVYEDGLPDMNPLMDNPNPLDDELMYNFVGRPDYFITSGSDGKSHAIRKYEGRSVSIKDERDDVYTHAYLEWNRGMIMDHALQDLIRPHAIEWARGEEEIERETRRFQTILKKVEKEISEYNERENTGHLPRPNIRLPYSSLKEVEKKSGNDNTEGPSQSELNDAFQNTVSAFFDSRDLSTQDGICDFITQMRFHALWAEYNSDPSFRFHDYSWKVDVVDTDGHVVPWDVYNKMDQRLRRRNWENGTFDVKLQSIPGATTRRIARMMVESGEMKALMEKFARYHKYLSDRPLGKDETQEQRDAEKADLKEKIKCMASYQAVYIARTAVMLHGNENRDPEDHPYLTLRKAGKQAHELLQNLKMNKLHQAGIHDIGALEFLADHKDEAEAVILAYIAELDRIQNEIKPPTPTQRAMMGEDPVTGDPLPYIHNIVKRDALVSIPMPDGHMQKPLSYPDIGARFVIAQLPANMNMEDLQKHIEKGHDIEMVGIESGEHRLAAQAKVIPLWESGQDRYFDDELNALRLAYQNIDAPLPTDRNRLVIIKMEDNPRIAGLRSDGEHVDPSLQSIHIPYDKSKKTFESFFSETLGNVRQPIRGLVLRSDRMKQDLHIGDVRLREMDESGLTGREIEHRIVKRLELNMKKIMKAYHLLDERPDENYRDFTLDQARDEGFEDTAEMLRYMDALLSHKRFGYHTKMDFYDSVIAMFSSSRHAVMDKPEKYNIDVIHFAADKKPSELKASMVYFDLYNRPHAALEGYSPIEQAMHMEEENKPIPFIRYAGAYEGRAHEI